MARGWESKGVEAQQADKDRREPQDLRPLTPEEVATQARRRTLELSRARAVADLSRATHPSHRATLEAALRAIDDQLRQLE
jgi:hypothetical protein